MNMNKNTLIKVNSAEECLECLYLLQKLTGKTIHKEEITPEEWVSRWYPRYTYIIIKNDYIAGHIVKMGNILDYSKDLKEIVAFLVTPPKRYTVNHVAGYTAKITDDGIEVGCKTVSFKKFQELVDEVEEFMADKVAEFEKDRG